MSHAARIADVLERIAAALEREASATPAVTLPMAEALSKEQAAQFLGVPVGTVASMIRYRKLEHVRAGEGRRSQRVVTVEALRRYLAEHRVATAAELLERAGRKRR